MDSSNSEPQALQSLKAVAYTVYVCQLLIFLLAGIPLLAGIVLNFLYRREVQGTWLQSHFDWQITTAWTTLAGLALAGLTLASGIGLFILLSTLLWLLYRISLGCYALTDNKPIRNPYPQ